MQFMSLHEERGSGIDKNVFQTEFYPFPALFFEEVTRSILFAPRSLARIDRADCVGMFRHLWDLPPTLLHMQVGRHLFHHLISLI